MKLCDYIFKRLGELGIGDVFCIPGESVQEMYHSLLRSQLQSVLLSHEPCAGYAADAYSRLKGLGAVLVSYGVGSLNLVNAVGQAYAESSPLIVLSGGPGVAERKKYPLLHHKVRTFQTSQNVFDEITAMSIIIESPANAAVLLERAFQTALRYKKPVYIEIPRDICNCEIEVQPLFNEFEETEPEGLQEALDEVIEMINNAKTPVILADVEVSRIKMQKELLQLVEKTGLPVASTLLGKSVLSENHPQSLGTFFGKLANQRAGDYLESADLILAIGTILSDVNLGMFTFQLDRTKMIEARIDNLRVKNHHYPEMTLKLFLNGLLKHPGLKPRKINIPKADDSYLTALVPAEKISSNSIILILNQFINRSNSPTYRIVSDVGDCLFMGQELRINKLSSFLSPAYYLSMGFAVPGGIGAQIADPSQRSLILVGDGAFQMTGLEIISANRLNLNPIIILLNNGIYATLDRVEENSLAGSYDIGKYDYYKMAEIFGGAGYKVTSTTDLQNALHKAETEDKDKFVIIQVDLAPDDTSDVLNQFGQMMSKSNKQAAG
jgi:TPP-dependent 2-oxoacid decarboxylase